MLRFLDRIADWIVHELDARAQLRFGVLCVLASIPLAIYGPLTDEPLLVYEMSAVALTLTGIGIVLSAEVLEAGEGDDDGLCQECRSPRQ